MFKNQAVLDNQSWEFDLLVNTNDFVPGNYTMELSIWDMFHKDNPLVIIVNLYVSYFVPPVFDGGLISSLTIQIWNDTKYNLPSISDADGDFSKIIIKQQK